MIIKTGRNNLKKIRWFFAICLLLSYTAIPVFAVVPRADLGNEQSDVQTNDQEITLAQVKSGRLLFNTEQKEYYKPALLLKTEMSLQVNGLIAIVNVKQHFKNTGRQMMEGIYVFPLPEDAAVNKMRIQIGDRIIEGEIKEKQAAKAIYKQARVNGQHASLVEQERPNMFTNSIANIAPDEEIIVEITYLQNINYDQCAFSLRFPMTITPRYIPGKILTSQLGEQALAINQGNGWAMNTDQVADARRITPPIIPAATDNEQTMNPIQISASIDMSMPLESITSPYHSLDISQTDHQYHIVLKPEVVSMDRDFVLKWTPVLGQEPQAALFSEHKTNQEKSNDDKLQQDSKNDNYLMLMLMPPQLLADENRLPREMIFIIDTSGSMGGTSIRQAKESLSFALTRLSEQDKFNIVEFNSQTSTLFSQSTSADKNNIRHALNFVAGLNAGGGTEMAPALMTALKDKIPDGYLRQVVFMTDGSVGNEKMLFTIIHEHLKDARLFTIGIGSAPNSYFMNKAAQFGRGTFTYIGSVSEVQQKMSRLFHQLESPVISHLTISWPQKSEVYPKRIPDLYMGEPLIVTAKVPELKGELIIEGQTQQGVWRRTMQLTQSMQDNGVGTVWARNKISALMDKQIQGSSEQQIKPQIIKLALKHQLLSKYTSFIAVDKTPVSEPETILKRELIANVQPRGQINQRYAYPKTATPAMRNIIIGLLLLLLLAILQIRLSSRQADELL